MKFAINQATLMKTSTDVFLDAISKAGFKGVELRRDETFFYLNNHSIDDLNKLLKEKDLQCITFNAIELFSLCSEIEFQKIYEYTEKLMNIGNHIGCDTIIAVPSFIDDPSLSNKKIKKKTVKRLKILANLADKYNFKLGFEPLGFTNCSVRKINFALEIINNRDLPEMGLVIDTFHFFLGEHSINDLETIPIEKLWLIHINDAIEKPLNELQDYDRVLPQQGFFNLELFVNKIKLIGYDNWLSLELFNEQLWKNDPYIVAQNSISSLARLI
jgi:2-keto-myo-inositol isomerase